LQAAPITDLSATELVRAIAAGVLSARDAVAAHIDRIQAINPRLNALVTPRFEQALEEAHQADQRQARGEPLPPLHGLPITIKDFFDLAGLPTTAGLTARAQHCATSDAHVVARLRQAGAIVLGKTNVAQLGMMMECDNPLFGRTNNPWDLARSPGGSTGGEAALIAAHGSPLGLGSDGGGSIRQPCHCTGIAGLKPTSNRLSLAGHWHSPSFPDDWVQPGPMARGVEDLQLAWRVLSGEQTSPSEATGSIAEVRRVGIYVDDGLFRPSPAVRRAVGEAAAALARGGVEVVEVRPPLPRQAWQIYMSQLYADGCDALRLQLTASPSDWRIRQIVQFGRAPSSLRRLAALALRCTGQRHLARLFQGAPRRRLNRAALAAIDKQRRQYQIEFMATLDAQQIDAIVCPPSALVAPRHGNVYVNLASLYTALFNLLGWPAGVVPVTRVGQEEESDRQISRDVAERAARRTERDSAGLPVGVQVAARPGREDLVLSVLRLIEQQRGSDFNAAASVL
jgi:fatty acid amide hydrolase